MMPELRELRFAGRTSGDRLMHIALIIAGVWAVGCIFGWIFQPAAFYRSYLFAWLFWLGVAMGSMGVVMLHNMMGGEWGVLIRRLGEHAGMTLPLLIVLFIPIAIGVHSLFSWSRPEEIRIDALIRHKQPYLNVQSFLGRAVIYFAIWLVLAWYLRSRSLRHDRTGDLATVKYLNNVSAGGMVLYFISMSLAGVDWFMSRDPDWVSTVFGFVLVCGQGISGLCLLIFLMTLLVKEKPLRDVYKQDQLNDLGNLLLTMVILWSYLAFAQLLVIWMGNKQEEVPWYVQRLSNGWGWIGAGLLIFHFFVPFLVLLMRQAKRRLQIMRWLCAGLLLLRAVDVFWMIAPSGRDSQPLLWHSLSWMDFMFPIGMGGLWLAMFLWLMAGRPIMIEAPGVLIADAQAAPREAL